MFCQRTAVLAVAAGALLAGVTAAEAVAPAVSAGKASVTRLGVTVDQRAGVTVVVRRAVDKPILARGSYNFCDGGSADVYLRLTKAGRRAVDRALAASGASTATIGRQVLITATNPAGEKKRLRVRRAFKFSSAPPPLGDPGPPCRDEPEPAPEPVQPSEPATGPSA